MAKEDINKDKKIEAAVNKISYLINADGGDRALMEVTHDRAVKVKLIDVCGGYPMSQMTLKMDVGGL